ncbi:MAG TPA: hypothetical protein VEB21_16110 [Terriglobales bacterium]|nr:hypothetical protein [Terriglobales bacterium]
MISLSVPGRLCLFGEHSDWAGEMRREDPRLAPGLCLIAGTDQGITAIAEPARRFEIISRLADDRRPRSFAAPADPAALFAAAHADPFFRYAAATAAVLIEEQRCGGVRIEIRTNDLPMARGLSSSAAICVLIARAFHLAYRMQLTLEQEMDLAYRGERAAGSLCGRMDQACAYGKQPVLLSFDGDAMGVEAITPAAPIEILVVDLMHHKDTPRILADLRNAIREDEKLRLALGSTNLEIVRRARDAVRLGDAATLGTLMTHAQEIFDRDVAPHSPELSAPRLHAVLHFGAESGLSWGGKGVGSQGDGCAQFVCRDLPSRDQLARQITAAGLGRCLPLTLG